MRAAISINILTPQFIWFAAVYLVRRWKGIHRVPVILRRRPLTFSVAVDLGSTVPGVCVIRQSRGEDLIFSIRAW